MSQCEHYWDEPRIARFYERLGEFARVILFDRRGIGMSDPPVAATLEEQMDDVRSVVHAAGATRVAVFAHLEAGPMAMLFAATHPDLVGALILYHTFARTVRGPDYAAGDTAEQRQERVEHGLAHWGDGSITERLAPSQAHDPALRAGSGTQT